MNRTRTAALALIVGVAALGPLFGDARVTVVTHPIWARMLLRALDMNEAARAVTQGSEAFSALSGRDSVTFPADRYLHADGVTVHEQGGLRWVHAGEGTAQVVYALSVVHGGDYQMRVRLGGSLERAATAEIVPVGGHAPPRTFTFAPPPSAGWSRGRPAYLDPGSYTAALLLPPRSDLEYVEVAPPCLNPIEPAGGWKPAAPTTVEDVAVTSLKAMDLESELPPADTPLERTGADFQVDPPAAGGPGPRPGLQALTLRAGSDGLQAVLTIELKEPGLYTLSALVVTGKGQRWLADSCRKAVLCPSERAGWRAVMSQPFAAGRHTVTVALAEGAVVERVRLERKKDGARDYLATLRRLGFDPGADGPVSWDKAAAAMQFTRDRRSVLREHCGDIVLPDTDPGKSVALASPAGAPAAPAGTRLPAAPPPNDIPLLPPQETASPVRPMLAAEVADPSS